jgi:hypothetical protein
MIECLPELWSNELEFNAFIEVREKVSKTINWTNILNTVLKNY